LRARRAHAATGLHSWPVVSRLKEGSVAEASYSRTLIAGKVLLRILAVRDVQMNERAIQRVAPAAGQASPDRPARERYSSCR